MLTYTLKKTPGHPLYEQLYQSIRDDIAAGRLPAGPRLPSKRVLAAHLGVSVVTVESAYAQLLAEGYAEARPRSGVYVCAIGSSVPVQPPHMPPLPQPTAPEPLFDLSGGTGEDVPFPASVWVRTMREVIADKRLMQPVDFAGAPELRAAIAAHLEQARGLRVSPEQIFIGAGTEYLYGLIVQLLGRRLRYAVEDPGYARLTQIYRANNVALSHVPMDEGGIEVEKLRRCGADVLHIMPSHQYPTGLVTAISRRYELLGWASEENGRFVIEDDYDCEFRLAGRPIPALQTIDASERVIYTNTFTKSLGPAFRIGYMVLPEHLATRFEQELGFYSCTVSAIDQLALARFIENGDYERHVNRMRTHYRSVRNDLIAAFKATSLADRMSIEAEDSGLHFILGIKSAASEQEIARAAQARGVALAPLSSFYQDAENLPNLPPGTTLPRKFVISYTGIARESIESAARAIAQAADG